MDKQSLFPPTSSNDLKFFRPLTHVLPPMWIPERPHPLTYFHLGPQIVPHNTSQRENGPNYHFHLGLLSASDPPDPHRENPPQLFQSNHQTLTMEVNQPSHYLFHKIISRWLWKNLNREVHLCRLPHLLSQSFCLFCP